MVSIRVIVCLILVLACLVCFAFLIMLLYKIRWSFHRNLKVNQVDFTWPLQLKKRKIKDEKKRKAIEIQKAKDEQLSRKRQREERRERYRVQDKAQKKMRRHAED